MGQWHEPRELTNPKCESHYLDILYASRCRVAFLVLFVCLFSGGVRALRLQARRTFPGGKGMMLCRIGASAHLGLKGGSQPPRHRHDCGGGTRAGLAGSSFPRGKRRGKRKTNKKNSQKKKKRPKSSNRTPQIQPRRWVRSESQSTNPPSAAARRG